MAQQNLSAVLYGVNDIRLENRPVPKIKDNQVLLKMECVGICGSDVHYLKSGQCGPFIVKAPMVIGHEASGTVYEVGKNVKHLKKGDRVAIEPGVGCRTCNFCKDGRYHLCPDMVFCATPPIDGNLSRFYAHDADFCFKLPDNMSLEEGAIMEPLSVGVHACKRAGIKFGDVVVVLGAGPIGLVTMLAAKAMGAKKVLITDIVDHRLSMAKSLGANFTLNVGNKKEEQIVNEIKTILGEDPDVSLDCTGQQACVRVAVLITKTGGVVTLVGMGGVEMQLPLGASLTREVDIRGVFRYVNDYPTSIDMVSSGKINVKPLITHHFRMEDTVKAFETAVSGQGNPVKIMIHANPDWKP